MELEEIALKDDYFVERKLYPNVDFYSGIIYNAIGTPANMFTDLRDGPAARLDRPVDGADAIRISRSGGRGRSTPVQSRRTTSRSTNGDPMGAAPPIWVDGSLRPADAAVARADDSAFCEGRGCYTSVRIRAGAPRFADRHIRRLMRGADALGLPDVDPHPLAPRARRPRPGRVLRRRGHGAAPAVARRRWRAARGGRAARSRRRSARVARGDRPVRRTRAHCSRAAASSPTGCSRRSRPMRRARRASKRRCCLIRSAALVEGTRTNVVALGADGALCTPPTERGAVAGIALEVASERLPSLLRRDLSRRDLLAARGVAVINAVRGARALVALDGAALGAGGCSARGASRRGAG